MKGRIEVIGFCVFLTLLGAGAAYAEENAPSGKRVDVPQLEGTSDQKAPADLFLPLLAVIRQYSEKTGNHIKLSQDLQADEEVLKKLYSSQDDTWLEEFSRVEYVNKETEKKEIILLGRQDYDGSGIVQAFPGTPLRVPQQSPAGKKRMEQPIYVSREQLIKLTRFPFRPPYPVELLNENGYEDFFSDLGIRWESDLGIRSEGELADREVVMKVRTYAQQQLRLLRRR